MYMTMCVNVNMRPIFLCDWVSLKMAYLSWNMYRNVNHNTVQHIFCLSQKCN